jgi:RNA polymerase sigma-70 factor (ECF subfamily)
MAVVYLAFNEAYAATSGDALVRRDLAAEAIRLGRLPCELMPDRAAPRGRLALMLLHDSRRDAPVSPSGDVVLLEDQDRARWDHAEIDEGLALVEAALRAGPPDAFALQAAIAALHARAASAADTDWAQIAALYAALQAVSSSPGSADQSRDSRGHGRRVGVGPASAGRTGRRGRAPRQSSAGRCTRRHAPAVRPSRGGGRRVPRGADVGRQRARTPLPRAPAASRVALLRKR